MPATHRGPGPAHPAAAAGRLVRRLRGLLRPAGRPCAAGRGGEPWPGHSSTSSTRRPAGRWLPSRSRTAPRTARLAAEYHSGSMGGPGLRRRPHRTADPAGGHRASGARARAPTSLVVSAERGRVADSQCYTTPRLTRAAGRWRAALRRTQVRLRPLLVERGGQRHIARHAPGRQRAGRVLGGERGRERERDVAQRMQLRRGRHRRRVLGVLQRAQHLGDHRQRRLCAAAPLRHAPWRLSVS